MQFASAPPYVGFVHTFVLLIKHLIHPFNTTTQLYTSKLGKKKKKKESLRVLPIKFCYSNTVIVLIQLLSYQIQEGY